MAAAICGMLAIDAARAANGEEPLVFKHFRREEVHRKSRSSRRDSHHKDSIPVTNHNATNGINTPPKNPPKVKLDNEEPETHTYKVILCECPGEIFFLNAANEIDAHNRISKKLPLGTTYRLEEVK